MSASKTSFRQLDPRNWLNPTIAVIEQVGSREIELAIEKRKEAGHPVIQVHGYPIVPPPRHIYEAAAEAAKSTAFPPSNGLPELRQALAEALCRQYSMETNPDTEILITSGAMNALHVIMTAVLRPRDEVLLISPCYFFGGLADIIGARSVYAETFEEDGYAIDFDRVKRQVSSHTKAIVLSSPVNPTGYVYSRRDVEAFISLAEEHNLLIISDESYDRMLYGGREHISPAHYPEARNRTVLVKSFTKSYALPTWRVGYLVADSELTSAFRKVLEWTVLHCPYINQRAALAAVEGPQDWLSEVFRTFELRRDQLLESLYGIRRFSWVAPEGGPFLFLNVSQLAADSNHYAQFLLERHGIPAVAGRCFNDQHHVRIPFGGTREAVAQLCAELKKAAQASSR